LLSGTIMRPLSDLAKIPREKLAYILDSTTASVCVLVPFLSWGAYLISLIVAQGGPVSTLDQGMDVFVGAIGYNFYPILLVLFTLGICLQLIPDFGPMRKAEKRASEKGLLLREGAVPLLSDSHIELSGNMPETTHLFAHLVVPVGIVLGIAAGSYLFSDSIYISEAFMIAMFYLIFVMFVGRQLKKIDELTEIIQSGIRNVLPALLIIALAYSLNAITTTLGAADWLIQVSEGLMTPRTLVAMTFLLTAIISFATGTSWGAYALMIPLALPLAYSFTGGTIGPLVYKTVAAVTGGGIFGDHASPLSDTSVLSSAGAGSDHIGPRHHSDAIRPGDCSLNAGAVLRGMIARYQPPRLHLLRICGSSFAASG